MLVWPRAVDLVMGGSVWLLLGRTGGVRWRDLGARLAPWRLSGYWAVNVGHPPRPRFEAVGNTQAIGRLPLRLSQLMRLHVREMLGLWQ